MSRLIGLSVTFAFSALLLPSAAFAGDAPGGAAPTPGASTTPAPATSTSTTTTTTTDSGASATVSVGVGVKPKKVCPPNEGLKPDDPTCSKGSDDLDTPLKDDLDLPKKKDGPDIFIGMQVRDFIVPHFFFGLFASGGPSDVNIFSFGPEMTYRSGNLEVDVSAVYADFSMNEFLFKNKTQPQEAFEIVSSDLKVFSATVDLLGNINLDKQKRFAILLGGGIGLGGVAGNLYRNQAYPNNPKNPDQVNSKNWTKCAAANDPKGVQTDPGTLNQVQYCDASNNHYGSYSEASWAHGGSKPNIWPYIALPHIAFRVQPVKVLQLRVDTGFSLQGFFVGGNIGFRLPL